MKKLLKWVLPAFLGIVPILGAEPDKAFLSHDDAIYAITRVKEAEAAGVLTMTATVDATLTRDEKIQRDIPIKDPFGRFVGTSWVDHDDELFSCRKGKVYVTLFKDGAAHAETSPFPYTREEEVSYVEGINSTVNLLQGAAKRDGELSLGAIVDVARQKHYTRPDGKPHIVTTILNKALVQATLGEKILADGDLLELPLTTATNPAIEVYKIPYVRDALNLEGKQLLFKLAIRENRVAGQMFYRCYDHKNETSGKGFSIKTTLRHWYEHYNTTIVTRQVIKILGNDQEVVYLAGKPLTELRINGRDTGRTNQPNCTPLGQAFPPDTKVV